MVPGRQSYWTGWSSMGFGRWNTEPYEETVLIAALIRWFDWLSYLSTQWHLGKFFLTFGGSSWLLKGYNSCVLELLILQFQAKVGTSNSWRPHEFWHMGKELPTIIILWAESLLYLLRHSAQITWSYHIAWKNKSHTQPLLANWPPITPTPNQA